jgi:hypothetical protein
MQDRSHVLDAPHEWIRARVRRARVLQDSFEELNSLGDTFFFLRAQFCEKSKKNQRGKKSELARALQTKKL